MIEGLAEALSSLKEKRVRPARRIRCRSCGKAECYDCLGGSAFEERVMKITGNDPKPDMTKGDIAVMSANPARGCLVIKAAYNPYFSESLKRLLKPSERRWNPEERVWEIHPSRAKEAESLLRQYYGGVQIMAQRVLPASKLEKLLGLLTEDDKKAIYRLLACKYHPDRGGSHEAMSLINEVFRT